MPIDRTETPERLARIDRMIEQSGWAKQRRLLRRAIKLWRKAEAQRQSVLLEAGPERIH